MNPDFDEQLEGEIDRHLKGLPDLPAPPMLVSRTMLSIARPAAERRIRSWADWPVSIRAAYTVGAVALLVSTFFGLRLFENDLVAPMLARFTHWTAGAEWVWNAVTALASAGTAVLSHASKGIVVPCILAIALAYAMCIGFGTAFVKLALSAPRKN
jgi:hypothetical protein